MKFAAYFVLIALVMVAVGQAFYHLPHLPERVASHFQADGTPDGFMSKTQYLSFQIGLNITTAFFLAITGATLRFIPNSMINVPNREYWLAPQRRGQTLNTVEITLLTTAIATIALFIGLAQLTFQANIRQGGLSQTATYVLVGTYIAVVAVLTIRMLLRFSARPQ